MNEENYNCKSYASIRRTKRERERGTLEKKCIEVPPFYSCDSMK